MSAYDVKHTKFERGTVWCRECGRKQKADSKSCLQSGWPRCCGYTMIIDSTEEDRSGL